MLRSFLIKIRTWPGALVAIGIGALLLRLIYLAELRHTPFVLVLIGDARQYDSWAQQIAGGEWIGSEVFYQTPLYPYFLAVIFKLVGHHLFAVRVVQAVLGATSCVLLGFAGSRFFGRRVGLIAAFLLAIYPPAIFFDGLIQKSSLDLFLMTAMLAVLGVFIQLRHWKWLILAGVVVGLFTLNRENARIIYPIIVAWLLICFRPEALRRRVAWAAIFSLAIAAVLLPIGLRNYHVGGDFLISTSQLGSNLYIGNHPGALGSYEPLVPERGSAEYEREDAKRLAEEATGRKLSPAEVSDYWVRRVIAYVRGQPGDWLELMGRKLLLTFSGKEAVDTESIEAYSQYSLLLHLCFWISFGLILPLGVFGAWQTREDWQSLAILYAILVGLALSVAVFYVVARYRYPIVPIVLLFAAAAVSTISGIRRAWLRQWLPGTLLAVAVAIPSNFLLRRSNDDTFLNVAAELTRMGRPAEAVPLLRRGIADSPTYAPLHFNLGVALNEAGDKDQALDEFAAAIKLQPDYFAAHSAMGLTLQETGRPIGALDHFREAARLRPDLAEAHSNLGNALAQAGRFAEAIAEYQNSLRLKPDNASTHNSLGVTLQQDGKFEQAVQHYNEALRLQPEDAGVHSNLALALNSTGNHEAAIQHFEEALRLQPDNVGIHINFADLLMRLGKKPEALAQYDAAAKLAPGSLDVLYRCAEAYASVGRLNQAIAILEKALTIAQAEGRYEEAQEIGETIKIYRTRMGVRPP